MVRRRNACPYLLEQEIIEDCIFEGKMFYGNPCDYCPNNPDSGCEYHLDIYKKRPYWGDEEL